MIDKIQHNRLGFDTTLRASRGGTSTSLKVNINVPDEKGILHFVKMKPSKTNF
jgi:hypothetical protein